VVHLWTAAATTAATAKAKAAAEAAAAVEAATAAEAAASKSGTTITAEVATKAGATTATTAEVVCSPTAPDNSRLKETWSEVVRRGRKKPAVVSLPPPTTA